MKIRIKYFSEEIEKLRYIDGKSDWIDLRSAENITLKAGEFHLIPLGVAMQLPEGYEAHVVPRSSTFKNFGIIQTSAAMTANTTHPPRPFGTRAARGTGRGFFGADLSPF